VVSTHHRAARLLKIKNIVLVSHWDYLSAKGIVRINPDQLWVWGEQMRNLAINFHKVLADRVKNIGVPQYQFYFDALKRTSLQNQNRSSENNYFLFAGTGLPYDELTPLKIIDKAIGNSLPGNIKIIYRPHPKQHERMCEHVFNQDEFKNVILDSEWMTGKVNASTYAPMEYYADLLNQVDGLITPFSTLLVEAALWGKPSFILGFSDDVHEWDFENKTKEEHIKSLFI